MNVMLILSKNRQDRRLLREVFGGMTSYDLSEDWTILQLETEEQLPETVRDGMLPAISCVDITGGSGTAPAEKVRSNLEHTLMVLVVTPDISPLVYIRPTIMPAGVLLKPLQAGQLRQVFGPLVRMVKEAAVENSFSGQTFQLTSHGTVHRVPMGDIFYFEARNKKMYLVTKNYEIEFYGTLDGLLEQLPADFLRCHKSFVINRRRVEQLLLSQGTVLMEGGSVRIPISRAMKQTVREALK